jgi:hypothetical protein
LAKNNSVWKEIQDDIAATEEVLGIRFEPRTKEEIDHHKLSAELLSATDEDKHTELINQMGVLRKSLG